MKVKQIIVNLALSTAATALLAGCNTGVSGSEQTQNTQT